MHRTFKIFHTDFVRYISFFVDKRIINRFLTLQMYMIFKLVRIMSNGIRNGTIGIKNR